MPRCAMLCRAVLCCAVLYRAVLCCAVPRRSLHVVLMLPLQLQAACVMCA